MASFPECSSIPLIFCSFRLLSLCFSHLSGAGRPVLRSFRLPDQGLALQQARCAIRGPTYRVPVIEGGLLRQESLDLFKAFVTHHPTCSGGRWEYANALVRSVQ